MANIKVKLSSLDGAAGTVERYTADCRQRMKRIDTQLQQLSQTWNGDDSDAFDVQWQKLSGTASTTGRMLEQLDAFAGHLRFARQKYSEAQNKAISRANSLPL